MFSAYLPCVVGRAFAEHGHAGQRGHRRRIAALGRPVAELVLLVGQPVESFARRPSASADCRSTRAPTRRGNRHRRLRNANHQALKSSIHLVRPANCSRASIVVDLSSRFRRLLVVAIDAGPPVRRNSESRPAARSPSAASRPTIRDPGSSAALPPDRSPAVPANAARSENLRRIVLAVISMSIAGRFAARGADAKLAAGSVRQIVVAIDGRARVAGRGTAAAAWCRCRWRRA